MGKGVPTASNAAAPKRKRAAATMRPPAGLAAAITSGRSLVVISEQFGLSRAAIRDFMADPDFAAEIQEIRDNATREIMDQLGALRQPAMDVVRGILEDVDAAECPKCGKAAQGVRLNAAELVFDRTGVPKRAITELAGSVSTTAPLSIPETAEVLTAAAALLDTLDLHDLATQVRAAIPG